MQLKPNLRLVAALCLCTGLAACQSTPAEPATGVLVEHQAQPEPLEIPLETEIAIAKISEIINSTKLAPADLARLYYDRGVLYNSVGLYALGRLDMTRAVKLKPNLADAYNFIGIHQTLTADFAQAFESFDTVLEFNPDYQFGYLNRGIALLYDGKTDLAVADFVKFQQFEPSDPYRALWRFIGESSQSTEQALKGLQQSRSQLDKKQWAVQIVAFYLGEISEQQLFAAATEHAESPKQLAERLCELYFYLAKWHALHNQPTRAADYLKFALSTNVYEFVEHRYARIELMRLRAEVVERASTAH